MQWKAVRWSAGGGEMREGDADEQRNQRVSELTEILRQLTPHDGEHPTAIPSLWLIRHSSAGANRGGVVSPAFCFTAQGRAETLLGAGAKSHGPGQHVVWAAESPVARRIVEATSLMPYLGLRVRLDRGALRSLIEEAGLQALVAEPSGPGVLVSRTDSALLDTIVRFLRLLRSPGEIQVLAPMIERELLFRLLLEDSGGTLHRVAREDRHPEAIDAAIGWLRLHFRESFRVDDLARRTGMSVSSFHHWFRGVTGISPLQFQKQLRLEEARRILRNEGKDVGTVSRWVGYESSSQFSREYRRLFGNPPAGEIRLLRQRAAGAGSQGAVR